VAAVEALILEMVQQVVQVVVVQVVGQMAYILTLMDLII
jgi:hypothetical protein